MDSMINTLTKAYFIIEEGGQPLAPETICIQCMFLSPSCVAAFHNDELYLEYIRNLVNERFNVSFPDEKTAFEQYFKDCIQLKEQLEAHGNFDKDIWLSYTTGLLEALKTPYYSAYSCTILTLESCFFDSALFDKVQKAFFSVIIKSSPKQLNIIKKIVEHAPVYKKYDCITEQLLGDILINTLALFSNEKWGKLTSLPAFFSQEEAFLETTASETFSSLASYLAQRTVWLSTQANISVRKDSSVYSSGANSNNTEHTIVNVDTIYSNRNFENNSIINPIYSNGNFENNSIINPVYSNENFENVNNHLNTENPFVNLETTSVDSEFLNTYAYNMTSCIYHANPAIGREQEISDLELILISPKKSPLLIGEAGVGKTSVVEGLSYRLQRGNVPDLLKNKKIFKLTTTSLLSGTKYVGEMEDRIKKLASELEAHPDVILFIDEIHTIVGAGSTESSNNDISNMLKPYIDRGAIKLIGATTREEYTHFLLPDKALARRFYPIAIDEPDTELTLSILTGSIPAIEYETKVKNAFSTEDTEKILRALITISAPENQPETQTTKRPELPLTLLEMAFSYAALNERNILSHEDVEQAVRHSNRLKKEYRVNFSLAL